MRTRKKNRYGTRPVKEGTSKLFRIKKGCSFVRPVCLPVRRLILSPVQTFKTHKGLNIFPSAYCFATYISVLFFLCSQMIDMFIKLSLQYYKYNKNLASVVVCQGTGLQDFHINIQSQPSITSYPHSFCLVREGWTARGGGFPHGGRGGVAEVGVREARRGDGPEGAQGRLLHHGSSPGPLLTYTLTFCAVILHGVIITRIHTLDRDRRPILWSCETSP